MLKELVVTHSIQRQVEMVVYFHHFWLMLFHTMLTGILLFPSASEKAPNYTFMRLATLAPSISYYDYVIVGGGTAGCPLAATLSEKFNVLLLERGDSPYGNRNISDINSFAQPLLDFSPSSPSQQFISEDGVINARARVLGGATCINAGFYSRAEPSFVKESGLDGKLVNDSYNWVEKKIVFHPNVGQWQSAFRDGLLGVGVLPHNNFTYDHLIGTKVGGTIIDGNGKRHTAADLLEYANPNRLTVLLHANVEKILFATKGKSKPLAQGVLFRDAKGKEHRAYLKSGSKNEIIISAGALGSPQLLMLSGIGPAEHLKSLNISVVLDQPFVGQDMKDNPMNPILVPSPVPVEVSLVQVVGITRYGNYIEAAGGTRFNDILIPSTDNFGRLSSKGTIASTIDNVTSRRGGVILEKIVGPVSKGHLKLNNVDPSDNPWVTFNYFQDPTDLQRCVNGIRLIGKVIESKAFSKFKYKNMTLHDYLNIMQNALINLVPKKSNNVTSLEQFCKENVMTIYHYHGGCRVGRVVDKDYKVVGVDGLRVLDGSTFDYSPGTNPQATILMLGRYMGVMIQRERTGNP